MFCLLAKGCVDIQAVCFLESYFFEAERGISLRVKPENPRATDQDPPGAARYLIFVLLRLLSLVLHLQQCVLQLLVLLAQRLGCSLLLSAKDSAAFGGVEGLLSSPASGMVHEMGTKDPCVKGLTEFNR